MATEGWHQDRNASLVLDHELQHHLMQVRPMISAVAAGDVHNLRLGLLPTVITAVDVNARAIERHKGRGSSQTCRRGGGHEAVECRHPIVIEGVQGPTERIIIELGRDHAGRHEAGGGLMLAAPGDEGERLIDTSQASEHQGFDRFPDGEVAHFRVLLGRFVNDIAHAKFVTHARDEAEVIEGLTAVGLFHKCSSQEEILPTPRITQIPSRVCGMSVKRCSVFTGIPGEPHFLEQFTRELGKGVLEMTPEAIHYLGKYDWPGNVRELAHEIKRLMVLTRGLHITPAELSPEIQNASSSTVRMSQ
jgi:hypothetical protein